MTTSRDSRPCGLSAPSNQRATDGAALGSARHDHPLSLRQTTNDWSVDAILLCVGGIEGARTERAEGARRLMLLQLHAQPRPRGLAVCEGSLEERVIGRGPGTACWKWGIHFSHLRTALTSIVVVCICCNFNFWHHGLFADIRQQERP
jgi:hypothetical protein